MALTTETLVYTRKYFSPPHVCRPPREPAPEPGDDRRNPVYVYTDEIVLAVNVALATRRPLLVRGPSGSGKSSLARSVALFLGWRYYEHVITSRTQARDLLWDIDLVRRLHLAHSGTDEMPADYAPYVVPGVLWWAFDRTSATWRGTRPEDRRVEPVVDPQDESTAKRAVVLLDEIDKADPDVPNNLLVPLGSLQFTVEETSIPVMTQERTAPLVVLTTNDERQLPVAFLRRCVEVNLELPDRRRLLEIVQAHFPDQDEKYLSDVARSLLGEDDADAPPINPAEFIDTVRACVDLNIEVGSETWKSLTGVTVWKHGRRKDGPT
jgi:MoxR-like ATPase